MVGVSVTSVVNTVRRRHVWRRTRHHVFHLRVLHADEQRGVAPAQKAARRRQPRDAVPVLVQGLHGRFGIFVLNHGDDEFHRALPISRQSARPLEDERHSSRV